MTKHLPILATLGCILTAIAVSAVVGKFSGPPFRPGDDVNVEFPRASNGTFTQGPTHIDVGGRPGVQWSVPDAHCKRNGFEMKEKDYRPEIESIYGGTDEVLCTQRNGTWTCGGAFPADWQKKVVWVVQVHSYECDNEESYVSEVIETTY